MMQSQEVYNLLDRIMPQLSLQFDVEIDDSRVNAVEGKDVVRLSKSPADTRAEVKTKVILLKVVEVLHLAVVFIN